MKKNVITVSENENLDQLTAKFLKYNFHTLPVIDKDNKLLGIVSYEDLLKIFLPHDYALQGSNKTTSLYNTKNNSFLEYSLQKDLGSKVLVSDIMDNDVTAAEYKMTMIEVRTLMKRSGVSQMPVIKGDTLVGFITLFDIIIALFKVMDIIE
ncbi:MAG: CBS domain-containing protein [Planctomycetota bacterium]